MKTRSHIMLLLLMGILPVLNDAQLWPLPLGIMQFQGQYGTDYARIMAYVTLLIIPAVIFIPVRRKVHSDRADRRELKG